MIFPSRLRAHQLYHQGIGNPTLLPNLSLSNELFLTPGLSIFVWSFFMRGSYSQWKVYGHYGMHLIAAKQVAIQGKLLPCSVLVRSLGQLLLGKSSCASRSLAGTCLVGMANEHQPSPKALTGGRAQVLRVKGGVGTAERGGDGVASGRLWLWGCRKFFLNEC